jgi:hypothetical protein
MDTCKVCSGEFNNSPDNLILCEHHSGIVHRGCCTDRCSLDGKPCKHCIKEYKIMGE